MRENKATKIKGNSGKEDQQGRETRDVGPQVPRPLHKRMTPILGLMGQTKGGGGGGGGGNPGWRPDRGYPIDQQVTMMTQVIGIAIESSRNRQADATLLFTNRRYQNVKLWLLQREDDFKRNPDQWRSDQD